MTTSTTATVNSTRPIHPNKLNFIEGVNLIFDSWTALTLAVQMEFAGEDTREKAVWLRKVMVDHFDAEGKKVEPEDLEDILLEVMEKEFQVNLEDRSEIEIARLLFDLYRECIRGEVNILNNLRKKAAARLARGCDVVSQSQAQGLGPEDDLNETECDYEDNENDSGEEEEESDVDME